MKATLLVACAVALLASGACEYSGDPENGRQACGPVTANKRCPSGFVCGEDNRCWRSVTRGEVGAPDHVPSDGPPTDGPVRDTPPPPDAFVRDAPPFEATPSRPLPSGNRQVPGGHAASSASYRIWKSSAPPPGTTVMQSQRYRIVGGIIGATQR